MNGYIERYIKQAATFFPIMGKPERLYLGQLNDSVRNHFFWSAPESLDEVIQVFGLPQTAVRDYLTHADLRDVVRRVRVRRMIRFCVVMGFLICFMAALFTAVHFGLMLHILYETEGYRPPVYLG